MKDEYFLQMAIDLSKESANKGGFPVGALLAKGDKPLSLGFSDGKRQNDPTLHAEIDAIRKLCSELKSRDLSDVTLYSSMEPCLMCYGASYWAHITRIVYAAPKSALNRMHYEGLIDSSDFNKTLNRKFDIIHLADKQKQAIEIISDWEKKTRGDGYGV